MNLIPMKYPNTYHSFLSDWHARTMPGGRETLETIWRSRKTSVIKWSHWGGFYIWFIWMDIENGMSTETHPGV